MGVRSPKVAGMSVAGSAPVLTVRGVRRTFDGDGPAPVRALRGLDLDVDRGEFVALTGPSGCGKSTLLQIVAGLDRPDEGSVVLDGRELTGLGEDDLARVRRRGVGFVFQFFNLLPTLTAEENIVLPTRIAGGRPDKRRLAEILDAVGLTERRRHKPSQMSGGQQQRVAIARAMLSEPTVLFADEPTGNLDSRSSAEILDLLRQSSEDDGQTTVMVTHDAAAATIADRIVFLADGRIVRTQGRSTAAEVLDALAEVTR